MKHSANNDIAVSRTGFILLAVALSVFLLSLFFAPFYFNGDQYHYANAYAAVYGEEYLQGLIDYKYKYVGSSEPIHYSIIWLASNLGIEKNLVMAVANSALAYLLMRVFIEWRVSVFIALLIVFTNFYVLVLYFAAERLKFGFIFFLLSLLYLRKKIPLYFYAFLSTLAHSQMIIIYGSILFSSILSSFLRTLRLEGFRLKNIFPLIITSFLALGGFIILGEHIGEKFAAYSNTAADNDLLNIWRSVVFLLLALLYSTDRSRTVFIFSTIITMVIVVGPERINMLAYCFFLFYALKYKRGVNAAVVLTSIYFGGKSIDFILRVLETGQGF